VSIQSAKLSLNITKAPLQYNWSLVVQPLASSKSSNSLVLYDADPNDLKFVHDITGEELSIRDAPFYNAREIHLIRKIQLRWMLFRAVKLVRQRALAVPISQRIQECIDKSSKLAFIGYKLEGVTMIQILVRSGYADIAQVISNHFQAIRKPLSLQLDDILSLSAEDCDCVGLIEAYHVRELKEFQTMYKKFNAAELEKKLALFNFYSDPYDSRSIQECIQASIEIFMRKFTRVLKTGQSRTRQSLQLLLDQSNFPHSHLQVETYLKKYSDKAELIRVSYTISSSAR
jgi:hypothetical protein